jgi:transcriptional regulator NrdR family protein
MERTRSPIKTPPNSPSKSYPCRLCSKVFPRLSNRRQHEASVHERPYICEVCDARFGTKQRLDYHKQSGKHNKNDSAWKVQQQLFSALPVENETESTFIPLSDEILQKFTETQLDSILTSLQTPAEFQDWLEKQLVNVTE